MNNTIGIKLIVALLDKYERSSFFRTGALPTKRILLKLYENGKCEFSEYNIENSEQRISVNECIQGLAQKGLVCFEWMKGEENHIISKVWLNMKELQSAYCFAHRQPQSDFLSNIEVELTKCMECIGFQWMKDYLQDACEYIQQKRKLHALVPENAHERKSLLQALRYIDANEDNELLKRIFSVRCFGDSKHFERVVETRLLRILKKYLDCDDQATDEQLLSQIGIAKYPEQFEFCGPISLNFPDGNCLDFSNLSGGSTVYGQDVAAAQIAFSKGVRCILSIENKANYFDYISKHRKPDELVIYHGGQYSPSKKKLFCIVTAASAQIPWYHWGDIDYGGFSMLARLRREINSSIQPYRMNKQELITYGAFTTSFSPEYSQKLHELTARAELKDCSECLAYMLEHRARLEQEAMLE
jgi:hypothetical protein